MKMKRILLTTLIIVGSLAYGQNNNTSNMSEANKKLLKELNEQEESRVQRVNNFLLNNPDVKATYKDGINIKHIYDILDGKPIYKATDNLEAARATKTDRLWSGGNLGLNLDGAGMTVGVWDGGPAQDTHPEFDNAASSASRMDNIETAIVDGDTGFSSHATHVAGTIAAKGVNSNAKGMASNVNVKSYNWINDEAEMVNAVNDPTNPIIISNHSYGVPADNVDPWVMGAYTQDARDIDNISRNNPKYLIVASAGNQGNYNYTGGLFSGYDKLTTDKNAKNSLVIANANPTVQEQPLFSGNYELQNLVINSGSSEGPTDDLRIKPDIAADGSNLFSAVPYGSGYDTYSGTSMSAPNTSGTLLLLQQYYNQVHSEYMNSSTLKGLVCHTAIDDNATAGPDPIFGWGFLDANAAVQTIIDANNGQAVIDELTLSEDETYTLTFNAQAGDKLSATLCWTDLPGSAVANGSLNDQTPRLVNDLDLRISKDGTEFFPWRLDYSAGSGFSNSKADNSRDNIERVDIDVPTTGTYTLTVTHKGTLDGNVGGPFDPQSQDFSLVVTGNNVSLSVEDTSFADNLSLYPNPSNGDFTVSFESELSSSNSDVSIDVIDVRGRVVFSNTYTSNSLFRELISLDNVDAGVYVVNISQNNSTTSRKLVIE